MKATSIIDRKTPVVTCRRAEELLHDDLYGLDHEEAWILYLLPRNTFIEKEMVSKGTLDKTAIDCRTILRQENPVRYLVEKEKLSDHGLESFIDILFHSDLDDARKDALLEDALAYLDGKGYFSFRLHALKV